MSAGNSAAVGLPTGLGAVPILSARSTRAVLSSRHLARSRAVGNYDSRCPDRSSSQPADDEQRRAGEYRRDERYTAFRLVCSRGRGAEYRLHRILHGGPTEVLITAVRQVLTGVCSLTPARGSTRVLARAVGTRAVARIGVGIRVGVDVGVRVVAIGHGISFVCR